MLVRNIFLKAKPAVERLYDRTATIERYEVYQKPNGADGMQWVTKHENVPCRLSTVGMQTLNNASQDDVNTIQYDVKVFLSSKIDVRAGDVFVIDGVRYESAKEPFVYASHQEVLLVRKGYA
ncbi:DUF3599 family protein [Anoxybacteroides amylolyticum]|uniref:Phage head-tail joining family protein n=1 Tax=Anoxybacteroides amylolyticum TaxID=294699 RepID=A0A160F7N2_9BACL|nr:DUF3599 family protein [Anoxybacillus amylolyticus]ANB62135.1 hypothetical protein GFC30_3168 [Anoxybacillus amylolyticus]